MAFAVEDEIKGMYNHWDSYPSGLGATICEWIETADIARAIEQFKALVEVEDGTPPTEDQKLALMRYADPGVSTRSFDEWYVILRDTQGDPQKTLDAGYYEDGFKTGGEEYGYLIDLTGEKLEIYSSYYYGSEGLEGGRLKQYEALVQVLTFEQIRAGDWDMEKLETSLEEEN